MQHGPGAENAYGGVAQAYSESVPILVMPMGYPQRMAWVDRNFFSSVSMRSITKSAEPITSAKELPNVMRRAFQRLRSGRGGPESERTCEADRATEARAETSGDRQRADVGAGGRSAMRH